MRNLALALTLAAAAPLVAQTYRVTHTYTLGGDGRWDYVVPDPPNHRLFIARQTRVMVVDEDSGKLLGEVTGIQGAHGTALAPAVGHGFATSGNTIWNGRPSETTLTGFTIEMNGALGAGNAFISRVAVSPTPPGRLMVTWMPCRKLGTSL